MDILFENRYIVGLHMLLQLCPRRQFFTKILFPLFHSSEWLSVRWPCFIAWYFPRQLGSYRFARSFFPSLPGAVFLSQPHSADCLSQYPKAPWRHNSRNGCAIFQRRNLHGRRDIICSLSIPANHKNPGNQESVCADAGKGQRHYPGKKFLYHRQF